MNRKYIVIFGVLAVLLIITFGYESGSTFPACRYWGGMMTVCGASLAFWIFIALAVVFVYLLLEGKKR